MWALNSPITTFGTNVGARSGLEGEEARDDLRAARGVRRQRVQVSADQGMVAAFLARRLGEPVDGLRVQVLAGALGSANFSALIWWARNDEGDPAAIAVAALDELLRGF